jgi:peptidoglycan/xylan/chitin deacetylase (PgdA/CDA1 family)
MAAKSSHQEPVMRPVTAIALAVAASLTMANAVQAACPANPDALPVSRTVEVDTTGGPGFGFEHFKTHDFLAPKEVVLTFDDGPWPGNTPAVLDALAAHCVKAIFFPIGKHALWHPEILKRVAAEGHTIGSHTWSHANLAKKSPDEAREEIERGVSAVRAALGTPEAPFFRFPALRHPEEMVAYLGERNIGIFSTDLDSFDFKYRKHGQLVKRVMSKLEKQGKGIVLMHDFQQNTARELPDLLAELKKNGYKIVQMRAKEPVKTLAAYDEAINKEFAGKIVAKRPTSSVIRTVTE